MGKKFEWDEVWVERIKKNLNGLEYGALYITVHDGRIVQLERTEKKRFDLENQSKSKQNK